MSLALFQLPDREQLQPLIERLAEECRAQGLLVDLSQDDQVALLRAVSGLTLNEAERALRLAVARLGGFRPQAAGIVVREKTQIIRKTGILDYCHSSESFAHVGGLGCGKSLSARALAGAWGAPLLRLDVGRIFGPIVGESEANLRRAIQTAEAVSPCILWIDEVEKGQVIFRIHLGRRRRDPEKFDLAALADSSQGFSGAEIEQAVVDALFSAFEAGRELEQADIAGALNATYPLSRARAAEIASLTEWARWNARPASARVPAGSFEE